MGKKIVCLFVMGLVLATLVPVGGSYIQRTDEKATTMNMNEPASQIQITIKGGMGVHAIIKNIGTTDLNHANVTIVLDGPMIFWGKEKIGGKMSIGAGKTHLLISPVLGFGETNIEVTVDTTTETASGKVLLCFVFGVQ